MSSVSPSRTMAHPAAVIWEALADFGAISTWAPNADHSSLLQTTEPLGVGCTRRVQVGRLTLLERVVTWDEPNTLAYAIEGMPAVVRSVRNEWRLEPVDPTKTEVTLRSDIDCGPRPPQRLIARIVGLRLASASASMLTGLAQFLGERPHG